MAFDDRLALIKERGIEWLACGGLRQPDTAKVIRELVDALGIALDQIQKLEEEKELARVAPLTDCVAPTGTTAEPLPGAVTAATRPEFCVGCSRYQQSEKPLQHVLDTCVPVAELAEVRAALGQLEQQLRKDAEAHDAEALTIKRTGGHPLSIGREQTLAQALRYYAVQLAALIATLPQLIEKKEGQKP